MCAVLSIEKTNKTIKNLEKRQVTSPVLHNSTANHLRNVRDAALKHDDFKQTRS
jgi:hypothetical protein